MGIPVHEHFCSMCYGGTAQQPNRKRRGGWWRCSAKPCVKTVSEYCKFHLQKLAEMREAGVPQRKSEDK